jgi:hypothetical protein
MAYRILHCGKSLTNYYLCLDEGIAGFSGAKAVTGDCVYFAVRVDYGTVCGARAILAGRTEKNPWPNQYPVRFALSEIEFCTPFDLAILRDVGGPYWPVKYIQGSKPIKDEKALKVLDDTFKTNKTDKLIRLEQ